MKQIKLSELNILNSGTTIYCSPLVYREVEYHLNKLESKKEFWKLPTNSLFHPNNIKINVSNFLNPYIIQYTYSKYRILRLLSRLLKQKLSLKLGLIKENREIAVYIINTYVFNPSNTPVMKIRNGVYISNNQ